MRILWHLAIIEWLFDVTFELKKKPCTTTLFTTRTNDKLVITEVVNDTITIKEVLDCTLKGLLLFLKCQTKVVWIFNLIFKFPVVLSRFYPYFRDI